MNGLEDLEQPFAVYGIPEGNNGLLVVYGTRDECEQVVADMAKLDSYADNATQRLTDLAYLDLAEARAGGMAGFHRRMVMGEVRPARMLLAQEWRVEDEA